MKCDECSSSAERRGPLQISKFLLIIEIVPVPGSVSGPGSVSVPVSSPAPGSVPILENINQSGRNSGEELIQKRTFIDIIDKMRPWNLFLGDESEYGDK